MNYTLIFLLVSLAAFLAPELLEYLVEEHSVTSTTLLYNKSIINKIFDEGSNTLTNSFKIRYKEVKYVWNQMKNNTKINNETLNQNSKIISNLELLLYKESLNKNYVEFMRNSVNKLTKISLTSDNKQNMRMITLNPASKSFTDSTGKFRFFHLTIKYFFFKLRNKFVCA